MRIWPDATFDTGGQQTLGFAERAFGLDSDETANGMALQPDGKLVVAGETVNPAGTESDLILARFLPDSQLDASFGDQGRVQFGPGQYDRANAVLIQPDGKIVVAGESDPPGALESNFLIARFNPDGTKDENFAFFGFNLVDFLGTIDRSFDLALTPDGKIVVAGFAWNAVSNRMMAAVARFTSDGVLDPTFDGDGRVVTEWPGRQHSPVTGVVVQPDGKIVLGTGYSGPDFALMRLNHVGEVCAQAMYQAQALTARSDGLRRQMEQAAREEEDHLAWCEQRLRELGSAPSVFNPLFYGLSFATGVGSTNVAKYIYATAAAHGKRVQAQGGAKNPVIVLPDADMEMATKIVADSAFGCAGQRCLAVSLAVTVGESKNEFTELICDAASCPQ